MHFRNYKHIILYLVIVLNSNLSFAQSGNIVKGYITDVETGNKVSGVSVTAPGISTVFTNDSGMFEIEVPNLDLTLLINGVGYQNVEVALKGKTDVLVLLNNENLKSVYDPVKTNYFDKPYSNVVYSADVIENTVEETTPVSPDELMNNQLAGLRVISRSGTPGIGSNMYLRGFNSLYATNQPLIVVDGMIYDNNEYSASRISGNFNNPLSFIDVKDIASITLVKDGNSIYGAKAANGVLYINTVNTNELATKIDIYTRGGFDYAPQQIPVMEANDFRSYLANQINTYINLQDYNSDFYEDLPYMNDDKNDPDYYRFHNNTNWQDEVFRRGYSQDYYIRVTGGDQVAKYGLSVGYIKNQGIVKNTDFSRYNIRFNADVSITSKVKFTTNLAFSRSSKNVINDATLLDANPTSPIHLSLIKAPIFAPNIITENGLTTPTIEEYDLLNISNPKAIIKSFKGDVKSYRFFGSGKLDYTITDNIIVSSMFGISNDNIREDIFVPMTGVSPEYYKIYINILNTSEGAIDRLFTVYNDNKIGYYSLNNTEHNYSAILGMRYNFNDMESDWGLSNNTPSDDYNDLGSGSDMLRKTGGDLGQWKWISYYANAEYDYLHKYFVSANISLDGSSRFGSEADGINFKSGRYGVFPSIGAAWIISSEKFMSSFKWVDLFKIRTSIGKTGNDDIGNYSDDLYYVSQRYLGVTALVRGNMPNKEIQWETVKKTNLGFDIAILNEKINLSLDLFNNKTENMLILKPVDYLSGFNFILANEGSLQNKGYEFSINSRILNKEVKLDIGANIAKYTNEVTALPEDRIITQIGNAYTITEVGSQVGLFYGYKTNGVYISDDAATNAGLLNKLGSGLLVPFRGGDMIFEESEDAKDGIINENDRQVIGDPNPDLFGSFNTTASWKGISVNILFTFSVGNDVYNMLRANLESMDGVENQTITTVNRWRFNGQDTEIPRAEYGDPMGNARFSDRWIEDGSYLRLKTVTVSYDIPIKTSFIQNAKVYASANNLLTFSKYLGYDPEFNLSGSPFMQGIDFGLTPVHKAIYFGLKIGL